MRKKKGRVIWGKGNLKEVSKKKIGGKGKREERGGRAEPRRNPKHRELTNCLGGEETYYKSLQGG